MLSLQERLLASTHIGCPSSPSTISMTYIGRCRSGWSCCVEGGSTWWTVLLEKRPARLSEVLCLFVCSCFQGTRVSPVHSCIPCMGHQDQWITAGKALYCTRYRRIVHRLCKCFILHLFLIQKRTPCSCSRTTLCGSALQKRCPDTS